MMVIDDFYLVLAAVCFVAILHILWAEMEDKREQEDIDRITNLTAEEYADKVAPLMNLAASMAEERGLVKKDRRAVTIRQFHRVQIQVKVAVLKEVFAGERPTPQQMREAAEIVLECLYEKPDCQPMLE